MEKKRCLDRFLSVLSAASRDCYQSVDIVILLHLNERGQSDICIYITRNYVTRVNN